MALSSYKQWRLINETFGMVGPIALGIGSPTNLGITGKLAPTEEVELDESGKCAKCGKAKCDCPAGCSKCGTSKMGADMVPPTAKKPLPDPDDPNADDVPDDAPEEDDDDSSPDGEEGEGDEEGDDAAPPEEGEEGEEGDLDITKKPMLMRKTMKNAMSKKMKKENRDFLNSVQGMLLSDPQHRFWDGFTRLEEESLIPPTDPNAGLSATEPKPGEIGYAPQGRIGS